MDLSNLCVMSHCQLVLYIFIYIFESCNNVIITPISFIAYLFTLWNYTLQPDTVFLIGKSINLTFLMEFISEFLEDVGSAKMSDSFTNIEIY